MTGDRPWIGGDLIAARALLDEIGRHAVECYPSECCGLVAGPADEPALLDRVIRETNEADKYHALDPETFPRTSRTYFKINELRASRAFEEGEASGDPIKVIYHSHCDTGDYFSAEDAATFARDGQLTWPCAFLVVSVVGGNVEGSRLWAHVPGTDRFEEAQLTVR